MLNLFSCLAPIGQPKAASEIIVGSGVLHPLAQDLVSRTKFVSFKIFVCKHFVVTPLELVNIELIP